MSEERIQQHEQELKRFFPSFIYEANTKIYNSEYEAAENLISKYISFDPLSNYLQGEVHNNKSFSTQKREDREEAIVWSQKAEKLCDQILASEKKLIEYIEKISENKNPSKKEIYNWRVALKIVIADSYLGRAMAQLQTQQYVYAAWNLNKAYKTYDSILKSINKKNEEELEEDVILNAKYGSGLFLYIISLIPYPSLQSIISMLGYKGDSELGIKYMKENYERDGLKSAYSSIILMMSGLFIPTAYSDVKENLKEVKPIIEYCQKKYPNGTIINFFLSSYERKTGNIQNAIDCLERGVESCKAINIEPQMFIWELGNSYLMLLDWKKASEYYEKVIEKKENGIEFLSLCALQLACTYSILGKDKEAIEILDKMESFCGKKGRFDDACSRKTKEILAFKSEDQKLALYSTTFEILFFRRDIAHMSEENLIGVLGEITKLKELNDDKNVEKSKLAQIVGLHVIEAAILSGMNKKEEGKASYLKAISFTKDIDKSAHHWIVAANYDLSEIYYREGDFKSCEKYLGDSSGYSSYDWEQIYSSRINKAKKELKKVK